MKHFLFCLCAGVLLLTAIMVLSGLGLHYLSAWPVLGAIGICAVVAVALVRLQ